jgi:arsenite methyltransferase
MRISGYATRAPVFLEHARANFGRDGKITFQQADARQLPLEDASADLVISHTTLCHVPNVEKAIGEAFRVLKPGGQFVVFDGD